jgi:hypothetical protein
MLVPVRASTGTKAWSSVWTVDGAVGAGVGVLPPWPTGSGIGPTGNCETMPGGTRRAAAIALSVARGAVTAFRGRLMALTGAGAGATTAPTAAAAGVAVGAGARAWASGVVVTVTETGIVNWLARPATGLELMSNCSAALITLSPGATPAGA